MNTRMLPGPAELPQRFAPPVRSWWSAHRWVYLRDLLRELIARDMSLRYKGSLLGQAWTLLNPIAELVVLLFVFAAILPLDIPNYAPFLFTGLLAYGWFQTSLFHATGAIVSNRELIKRPGFPPAILPIVTVGSTLVHFLLSLPILFVLLLVSRIPITMTVATLPALIAVQFLFTLSLAYPLAAAHVWLRDTQYLLRVALQLLFYLTPIFYETTSVPERFQMLYRLNPMVTIVEAYRDVLLRGRLPDPVPLLALSAAAALLLAVGLSGFRYSSHRMGDQL